MTLKEWNILLSHASDLADWIPFFIYSFLQKSIRKEYIFLGAYLLGNSLLKTCTLLILSFKGHTNTMVFYHIMALVEVICISAYFLRLNSISPRKIWIIAAIVLFGNILNSLFLQKYNEFNSNAWAFNTILLIGLGLYYFYMLFTRIENLQLEKHPDFLIVSGMLLYFSGSLFLYIVSSEVLSQEARGFFYNGWLIRSVSDILKSTILAYGLWMAKHN